jgi:hypothetical protein
MADQEEDKDQAEDKDPQPDPRKFPSPERPKTFQGPGVEKKGAAK